MLTDRLQPSRYGFNGYRLTNMHETSLTTVFARWNGVLLQLVERGLIKDALIPHARRLQQTQGHEEEVTEIMRAFMWVPHMRRFYQVFSGSNHAPHQHLRMPGHWY